MALIVLPAIELSAKPLADDCMSAEEAILDQLGGVGPKNAAGWKVRARLGNLDENNVAADAGFENRHKREPWSRATVNLALVLLGGAPAVATAACVPFGLMVERITLTARLALAAQFKGSVSLLMDNGSPLISLTTASAIGADASGVLDSSLEYQAEWIRRAWIPAGTWLRSVATPDAGYVAWDGELVLYGRALHV